MKAYESVSDFSLMKRMPMIIRVDGKAFHTLTRNFEKPWDSKFISTMTTTTLYLMNEIQGAKLAYCQSDEISILVTDYDTLTTESWFGKRKSKMESISAAYTSVFFNAFSPIDYPKTVVFDSRAIIYPKEEVINYFIWRQQDATRNSIQSAAQANFSHNEIQNLNTSQLQEKLFSEKGINWNDYPTINKRGFCVTKVTGSDRTWSLDNEIPIFTQDRNYIDRFVNI
jgi:tRNA(His) 5'-end guanylyltransferase